jgi:hypothetical protein
MYTMKLATFNVNGIGGRLSNLLEWLGRETPDVVCLQELKAPDHVVPTDFDIYDPKHWRKDALLQPQSREAFARLLSQGWLDVLRAQYPKEVGRPAPQRSFSLPPEPNGPRGWRRSPDRAWWAFYPGVPPARSGSARARGWS